MSYATPEHTATAVSQWAGMGVKLSKELTDAIEVFHALKYVEVGHRPVVKLKGVTPENAEAKVREFAEQIQSMVLSQVEGFDGNFTVLERSKRELLGAAARVVLQLATAEVPSIIGQLTPKFNDVVSTYTAAVNKLPAVLNESTLIAAGPGAIASFGEAQALAIRLDGIDRWSSSLASLHGLGGGPAAVNLRILRPTTPEQLLALDEAQRISGEEHDNGAARAIGYVWRAAVREGIEFGINTPKEAAAIRHDLEARRYTESPWGKK